MSVEPEPPPHPALIALAVIVGVSFVVWAMVPIVAEFIGAYLR